MNKLNIFFIIFTTLFGVHINADYIDFLRGYEGIFKIQNNTIFFKNNKELTYSDDKQKTFKERLKNASVKDMIFQKYPCFKSIKPPAYNFDPGRYRNSNFFKILYGKNKKDVEKNLTKVIWLPKSENKILYFNKNESAAKNLQLISNELDALPSRYKKYITNIAGTFNYRKIVGTNRLSVHSFGIAIDINTKFANYWKWDKNQTYKNQIPKRIIDIFEKHGFIWGGRWYHYDTTHFEYRPELTKKFYSR
ncbi:MAG: M15 family metallopeptidase [Campylobacteraceae bacterium]|nr:M15 family metallopeptidase [Campylobacteraceae bacterium]